MKQGWQIKKIGDVCDLMTGGTPSKSKSEYFSNGNIKWLVSGDIHQREIFDCAGRITEEGMKNSNAKYLPINSVIIALNGQGKTRGNVALLRTEATCNQSLVGLYPKDAKELLPEYLFLNLHGRYDEIRRITGDDTKDRRGLNMPLIRNIEIPIPPVPEQQRIVAILDESFAALASAKENAEKNLVNARELFDAVLQSTFANKYKGWQEKKLGDVTHLITDGKHGDCRDEENSGYYFLSAKDVKNSTLNYENARQIKKEDFEETHRRTDLKPGDVLVTNSGTIGRMAIAPDDDKTYKTTFQKSVAVIKPISSIIDNIFCCYHLKADLSKLVNVSAGTAQKNLLIGDLKNHIVRIPPISEQRAIVARLEALSAETQKLEGVYRQKLAALEELKKSVLAQAFEGGL